MNYHFIYKLIFPNKKLYIGQTLNYNKRMSNYKNLNKSVGRILKNAIYKHGWKNVKKEIICTVSEEFVDDAERYFIKLYKSNDRKFGYNIEDGGNKNKRHSKETIQLMSDVKKGKCVGKNHPMWGRHHSDESKEKNRQSHLGMKHSEKTKEKMRKPKHTKESKELMRNAKLGENNPMYGKIGKKHHLFGKKRVDISERNKKIISKRINMYLISGEFIKTFESIKQASEKLNIFSQNICAVLKYKQKTAGGYIFKYNID